METFGEYKDLEKPYTVDLFFEIARARGVVLKISQKVKDIITRDAELCERVMFDFFFYTKNLPLYEQEGEKNYSGWAGGVNILTLVDKTHPKGMVQMRHRDEKTKEPVYIACDIGVFMSDRILEKFDDEVLLSYVEAPPHIPYPDHHEWRIDEKFVFDTREEALECVKKTGGFAPYVTAEYHKKVLCNFEKGKEWLKHKKPLEYYQSQPISAAVLCNLATEAKVKLVLSYRITQTIEKDQKFATEILRELYSCLEQYSTGTRGSRAWIASDFGRVSIFDKNEVITVRFLDETNV